MIVGTKGRFIPKVVSSPDRFIPRSFHPWVVSSLGRFILGGGSSPGSFHPQGIRFKVRLCRKGKHDGTLRKDTETLDKFNKHTLLVLNLTLVPATLPEQTHGLVYFGGQGAGVKRPLG